MYSRKDIEIEEYEPSKITVSFEDEEPNIEVDQPQDRFY
jgi:hypothetical protein